MFKLTANTDPATIMFEGFPKVTLGPIRAGTGVSEGRFYVYVKDPAGVSFDGKPLEKGFNHAHHEDGTDAGGMWPRIVPRIKFDASKPLIATHRDTSEVVPIVLIETIIPANGDETRYVVRRGDKPDASRFEILASTGTSTSQSGSALNITNGPNVTVRRASAIGSGIAVEVDITLHDGEPVSVELVK